jgi:hypothetical protein
MLIDTIAFPSNLKAGIQPECQMIRLRSAGMKRIQAAAILAACLLVMGSSSGCLSLSMLNRESPDTKARLDCLESRVSALEAAGPRHPEPYPRTPVPSHP